MAPILDENSKASELVPYYTPQIEDKVILITGVSPGSLGESFVKQVAVSKPATFILAGRNPSKFQSLIDELKASHPKIQVKPLSLDLNSLANVRKAAETVLSWSGDDVPRVDVLVNNAGTMAIPYSLTEDGFETQFQTNHLGHFLFTNLIMSKILNAEAPRIINISSAGHRHHNIRWTDYNFNGGKTYEKWAAYGQSKTANCLFSVSLAKKLGSKGLASFSLHPGGIITNLSAHVDDFTALLKSMQDVDVVMGTKYMWGLDGVKMKDLNEGVATHVFAAFDPTIEQNGVYLNDCHVADPYKEEVYPWATSDVSAEMLWQLSEKLVGQKFEY
ncbi:short-chain dehydrogenase [Fusarium oxysporum Fo47]|uniref:Oxidoreductase n=1 Tax=Fusarium oxysporum Fo47 TaxID=660027 RepID=W9JBV7_FUSOX|nr:short-chain dehydrogenase [Fusarium oxysporum Fo47]EWZ27939.1 oxidoreductase [Fusarium oxysporum Fo47]QKD56721.1 short-chain dehydrogenase [Fusarium oxysporum Fo47]